MPRPKSTRGLKKRVQSARKKFSGADVSVITRMYTGHKRGILRFEVKTLTFNSNGQLQYVGSGSTSEIDLLL